MIFRTLPITRENYPELQKGKGNTKISSRNPKIKFKEFEKRVGFVSQMSKRDRRFPLVKT